MTDSDQRTNLGRGLAALFGEDGEDYNDLDKVRASKEVPTEFLHPNARQPRQLFEPTALNELAESVRENGVLQPILVRRHPETPSHFEIVAGERRWRAAQMARLHQVPVVIRELDDRQSLALALVENVQREDLTALEEAQTYQRLIGDFASSQQDLAKSVGKSRSHIANTIRLLELPDAVKDLLTEGKLTAGHARALLAAEDPAGAAKQVVKRNLNVRQTERLTQSGKTGKTAKGRTGPSSAASFKDSDTVALERDLSALLGLKVQVEFGESGGSIKIHYRTLEQLDDVLHRLHHARGVGEF